ncbi:MAG: MazG nucleotide pyrophosphohydrolase domain-containing protein, partial [Acidimicrobiales bacterium]
MAEASGPTIHVVGLGPAGPGLVTEEAASLLSGPGSVRLRTGRHPAAAAFPGVATFDEVYERAETFDEVYETIVDELVGLAEETGTVVYAVPGSPTVAERTVVLLGEHPSIVAGELSIVVHPAVSFADLAFARLGVDPVAAGVHLVDATVFATAAAGLTGPLLVAQCYDRDVLSAVKLAADPVPDTTVVVLHHLGLPDERIVEVDWDDLDRSVDPDHLTSLWVPRLAAPVAAELVALDELVHVLRERCPWDRRQTHGSLARHLLEEAHEALEAIDELAAIDELVDADERAGRGVVPAGGAGQSAPGAPREAEHALDAGTETAAVAALEEELGDVLFQVFLHATLAAEAGRFDLADVARSVHDKLVARHPHVFAAGAEGTAEPAELASAWEVSKLAEKQRASVTDGIPAALPALAVTAKLQRKAAAVGIAGSDPTELVERVRRTSGSLRDAPNPTRAVGDLLFDVVALASAVEVDAEAALRDRARRFRAEVRR